MKFDSEFRNEMKWNEMICRAESDWMKLIRAATELWWVRKRKRKWDKKTHEQKKASETKSSIWSMNIHTYTATLTTTQPSSSLSAKYVNKVCFAALTEFGQKHRRWKAKKIKAFLPISNRAGSFTRTYQLPVSRARTQRNIIFWFVKWNQNAFDLLDRKGENGYLQRRQTEKTNHRTRLKTWKSFCMIKGIKSESAFLFLRPSFFFELFSLCTRSVGFHFAETKSLARTTRLHLSNFFPSLLKNT